MRALCNREALLTASGMVSGTVPSSNNRSFVDDSDFENVRVVSLDERRELIGSSWLALLIARFHPDFVIGVLAVLVALGATAWVANVYAQVAIPAMTYSFSWFVIRTRRPYECKGETDFKNDARDAPEGPGKVGESE
jgi:hypothetical protein